MIVFCLYAVVLLCLGGADARRSGTSEAFFVNNRSSGPLAVALSIAASCVGGSATLGMAGLAWQIGTPAFWWLGSGACGLALLTALLARQVRASGAYTLPEIASGCLGSGAARLIAWLVPAAWPAILAAQFSAVGHITAVLTGMDPTRALLLSAGVLTAYAVLGGQASVIRSDVIQFALLAAGVGTALLLLALRNPEPLQLLEIQIVNRDFPVSRLASYLIILGGSYVVCPMLFGRVLSARDENSAVRGCRWAVCILVGTAAAVVLTGIACRGLVPSQTSPDGVLPAALAALPPWAGMLLLLALFSAMVSSADSCLITASTVFCNDVLGTRSVAACRMITSGIAVLGLALAWRGGSILNLLLMANDIYVSGVVAPVFVGLLCGKSFPVRPFWGACSVAAGGALGLYAALAGQEFFSLLGVAISGAICLWGAFGSFLRSVVFARVR